MKPDRIFLILLLLISNYPLYSSDGIRIGFLSSFTIPYYSGSGYDTLLNELSTDETRYANNPVFGFTGGAVFDYIFNDFMSLDIEVLLSGTGGGISSGNTQNTNFTVLISELNIEIPILLKTGTFISPDKRLYIMSGPQFSSLLFKNIYEQNGPVSNKTNPEWGEFEPFGIGILSGVGLEFYQKSQVLVLELRYLHEFTNSMKGQGEIKQNSIGFAIGIRLGNKDRVE